MKSKEKLENTKRGSGTTLLEKQHTKETLGEGLSAEDGCAMPKALEELRLGSKASVSALAAEMAILEWSKIKEKLETRKTAWNEQRTWRGWGNRKKKTIIHIYMTSNDSLIWQTQ